MAQYLSLLRVGIKHEFFGDHSCRDLWFQETADTTKLFSSYRLLMKPLSSGFELLADADWGFVPDEDLHLHILGYTRDNKFSLYTRQAKKLGLPPCYSIASSSDENITADYTGIELRKIPVKKYLATTESKKCATPGPPQKPALCVDIAIKANTLGAFDLIKRQNAPQVQIQLSTRAFYWKYYIFGELANMEIDIHDLYSPSPQRFDRCDDNLPDQCQVFISQQPIAMNETPLERFQLRKKSPSGRVLIKRLPNAGLKWIAKSRNLAGQQILVAEIYVNQ